MLEQIPIMNPLFIGICQLHLYDVRAIRSYFKLKNRIQIGSGNTNKPTQ